MGGGRTGRRQLGFTNALELQGGLQRAVHEAPRACAEPSCTLGAPKA